MAAWSPTLEGFRAVFRRPSLSLAEIAWRWAFGGAGGLLCALACFEYLDTLPVSSADLLLLRSGQPFLVSRAVNHVLRGSGLRVVLAALLLCVALSLLWVVLASLGRAAVLNPLLASVRSRASEARAEKQAMPESSAARELRSGPAWRLRSLVGLNFLRNALTVAAGVALVGAMLIAGLVSPAGHPRPGLVFLLSLALILILGLVWSSLNWFLSLAAVFVVRQGDDAIAALDSAAGLCERRFGAVAAVGTWFGLAHLTLFFLATSVVGFPLSLASLVPPGFVLLGVLLVTLAYFAIVDALHVGRLAGYVAILEAPAVDTAAATPLPVFGVNLPPEISTQPSALSIQPGAVRVDPDELILSDTPSSCIPQETGVIDQSELIRSDANPQISADMPPFEAALLDSETSVDKDEPILSDRPLPEIREPDKP